MVVTVSARAASLAGTLANMRSWLDHNHCTPARFEMQTEEPDTVLIRVEFRGDAEGEAFRLAFDGNAPDLSGVAA
jgi:hypothetical protein